MLPTIRQRRDLSSKETVPIGHNDAAMGRHQLVHASAERSEYNKRSDLKNFIDSFYSLI